MINTLDALNIVEKTIKDNIRILEMDIDKQEEYIASLRKNAKNRESAEYFLFQMKNKCDEFETKLAQFQIYKEKNNVLMEIKEIINTNCKLREDIFHEIGDSARLLDMYVEAAQRDGFVRI